MNIVNATTLRNNLADAIGEVSQKKNYLLVSKRGKISSALVSIDFLEDLLALNNKNYLKTIQKARKEYEKGEILTHDQVFGQI